LISSNRIILLVGTTKGAFLISGGDDRDGWEAAKKENWPPALKPSDNAA
jgi:hypothetical protein